MYKEYDNRKSIS